MADEMTPATEKTPDEIEREMLQTRESLTEKVEALEHQFAGTVQQVAGTVEAVKSFVSAAPETVSDTVKQAAAAVSESVKETFDITGHVRRHPLTAVGAAAALGCVVGAIIFRPSGSAASSRMTSVMAESSAERPPLPVSSQPVGAAKQPGILDELFGMLGDKAKELARGALESVSAALKESIQTQVPRLVNDAAARFADSCEAAGDTSFTNRFDARRDAM